MIPWAILSKKYNAIFSIGAPSQSEMSLMIPPLQDAQDEAKFIW